MTRVAAAFGLLIAGLASRAEGQVSRAAVADPGPGLPGRIVRAVAAKPHRVLVAQRRWASLAAGDTIRTGLIVVHGSARIDAPVAGDVVVVDGDLRLDRGARIGGRAVAIGGHVYRSAFATVAGDVVELPRDRFDADSTAEGWQLRWGPIASQWGTPVFRLPGFAGVRIAGYSRVDGLGVTFGPEWNAGPLRLRASGTWRTHRGVIDPAIDWRIGSRRTGIEGGAERTTATNETWMAGDVASAAVAFVSGVDLRNWYRADRAWLAVRRREDTWPITVEVWSGVHAERVSAAAPSGTLAPVPFALAGAEGPRRFGRANPVVPAGELSTIRTGLAFELPTAARMRSRLAVAAEVPVAPWDTAGRFTQIVTDWRSDIGLPFGLRLESLGRGVWSEGALPAQRVAAVGGLGTLLTEETLGLTGRRLVFGAVRLARTFGSRAGAPTVAIRAAAGTVGDSAAWGRRVVNVGPQLDLGPLRFEYAYDPASRRSAATVSTIWVGR